LLVAYVKSQKQTKRVAQQDSKDSLRHKAGVRVDFLSHHSLDPPAPPSLRFSHPRAAAERSRADCCAQPSTINHRQLIEVAEMRTWTIIPIRTVLRRQRRMYVETSTFWRRAVQLLTSRLPA
jgi:hypothetical protein